MAISPLSTAPDLQADHRADEATLIRRASALAALPPSLLASAQARARQLVEALRAERTRAAGVDALMGAFPLGSPEGLALMSLAEALLRIPDAHTADALIRDKLAGGDWRAHAGHSPSVLVNAACWGLVVSGALARTGTRKPGDAQDAGALLARLAEPAVRSAMRTGIGFLGSQFVLGETIEAALARAAEREAKGFRHSYDMLGEAALTAADADRYHALYRNAIEAVGREAAGRGEREGPGVSIKLSALHPRYARLQRERVLAELTPRLVDLAWLARQHGIGITVDAEEADRLRLSMEVIEAAAMEASLRDWPGFGLAVQAVQKRSLAVVDWALGLARRRGAPLMLRLVKGAYWDTEVKRAQVAGLDDYPVFTRKAHTDVSYLACARRLLDAGPLVFPQFATHNALTVCQVMAMAGSHHGFEFQCLHGMGESLYDHVVGNSEFGVACRIYAPVGTHETLLAYLVRRLLENGANASFVNQIVDPSRPVEQLTADPVAIARETQGQPHERVPKPPAMFGERRNARGWDLADEGTLASLSQSLAALATQRFRAEPVIATPVSASVGDVAVVQNPARRDEAVGTARAASAADIGHALAAARAAEAWRGTAPSQRAALLDRAADLLEARADTFIHLAIREAGKTLPNALGEVREAVDFCRFYAAQARTQPLGAPLGVVVAISPWNFPLAIFLGQVAAALAAGNAVLAKPAEQTPLMATEAVRLLHEAGFPRDAVQLLPGPGETVGAALVADARVDGVMFTGSTAVAQRLHRALAARGNPVLIAETGGQNALIVDSSALPEQAVADAITSAFDSAGQRCSALRVLCVQDDIADKVIPMLAGAMAELRVGDPARFDTDVGPIIDAAALDQLRARIGALEKAGRVLGRAPLPDGLDGHYLAPIAIEAPSLASLGEEIFGPVLRVHRFPGGQLGQVIDTLNAAGYGLTAGVHSRLDATIATFLDRIRAGNVYVNRNLVGAVVGVQPFGGEGLSGTGPKAGGPWTLRALTRTANDTPASHAIHPAQKCLPPELAKREGVLNALASQVHADLRPLFAHALAALAESAERVLPGPTGERNTWHASPRGLTVALGDESQSTEAWLAQAVSAVAAGNSLILAARVDTHAHAVANLLRNAGWLAVTVSPAAGDDWSTQPALAVVLAGSEAMAAKAARLVAAREGARIPVVAPSGAPWRYDIWRLQCERAVSVNTAAAGGNATLLAEAS